MTVIYTLIAAGPGKGVRVRRGGGGCLGVGVGTRYVILRLYNVILQGCAVIERAAAMIAKPAAMIGACGMGKAVRPYP